MAGVLLFAPLNDCRRSAGALLYGLSLALTFDEFGMWLHLSGSYWQRASFDAVITILAFLGVIAFAPRWHDLRKPRRVVGALALLLIAAGFFWLLIESLSHAEDKLIPHLQQLEQDGPR